MPPSPSSESRARSLDQAERTEEKGCGVTTHQKQIPNGTLRKERERVLAFSLWEGIREEPGRMS